MPGEVHRFVLANVDNDSKAEIVGVHDITRLLWVGGYDYVCFYDDLDQSNCTWQWQWQNVN